MYRNSNLFYKYLQKVSILPCDFCFQINRFHDNSVERTRFLNTNFIYFTNANAIK